MNNNISAIYNANWSGGHLFVELMYAY